MNAPLRILGIDPGLNRTGWGVIEVYGAALRAVDHGVIRVPAGGLADRLGVILDGLAGVIRATHPTRASVEQVFVNVNPQTTLALGQARGAALCAAIAAGLPVAEHSALQVKRAVVGYGRASKAQVQVMVQRLLALSARPPADAADALACAICEAHTRGAPSPVATARSGAARVRRSREAWRAAVGLRALAAKR